MSKLDTIKETECSCKRCRAMCHRPCWGTPSDIKRLIEAGHGDKLCLENHCGTNKDGNIWFLAPALKGYEGKVAPIMPGSYKGCTFWHYGKCTLHNKGLKPLGGKLAHHDSPDNARNLEGHEQVGAEITELWNNEESQKIVDAFCKEHALKKEVCMDGYEQLVDMYLREELMGLRELLEAPNELD
jgi:hypothetical protein